MIPFSSPKGPLEKVVLTFDFSQRLAGGATITSASTPAVSVRTGQDASPQSLLNGAATVDSTGTLVLVPVQGGVDSADYLIEVTAQTSNPLEVLALTGLLSVRS